MMIDQATMTFMVAVVMGALALFGAVHQRGKSPTKEEASPQSSLLTLAQSAATAVELLRQIQSGAIRIESDVSSIKSNTSLMRDAVSDVASRQAFKDERDREPPRS